MQKLNGIRNIIAFSALAFLFLTLHVCGAPSATTAAWLNNLYMGFDENDDDSLLGVTISMVHNRTLQDNLFCSALMNTTCYRGYSDCRTSVALYNHQMGVNATNHIPHIFSLSRLGVGFVINPTRVQTDLGKCAYAYDGMSFWRLNGGCGAFAGGVFHLRASSCSNRSSAFYDVCPSTNETCTADDVEIKDQTCSPGASAGNFSDHCFWGMPSLNYPGKLRPNHLREMVKARVKADRESPHRGFLTDNEIVLDDRLFIPAMRSDPAAVVSAFVYLKSSHGSRSRAEGMRDRFSEDYSVGKIPVIGLDDTVDFTQKNGPFIVEENGGLEVIMV